MSVAFQTREEARKTKEKEEAQKAGLIAPDKDEEGKDINPHIPQYISKAPWYLNQTAPGLKHQRYKEEKKIDIHTHYKQIRRKKERQNNKYEKGACENCGAKTHQSKDCLDRPRLKKAKYTNSDLRADEDVYESIDLHYDAKRDRYAGYSPDEYKWVIRDYELAEIERKRRKALEFQNKIQKNEIQKKKRKPKKKQARKDIGTHINQEIRDNDASDSDSDLETNEDSDTDSDSDNESDKDDGDDIKIHDFDQTSAPVESKDERSRINTKNLRIREDTAKYLLNLDINSAFYDPKSRSMRDNPFKHLKDNQHIFMGDNNLRLSGDNATTQKLQVFAWEAYKKGQNVHFNAQPTQLEYVYKNHVLKKESFADSRKKDLLEKYGGEEHLNVDKKLIYSQTETFVEFSRDGSIKPINRERIYIKSKYEEDVLVGNHTEIWGSWFDAFNKRWGFACCYSTDYFSDCKGKPRASKIADTVELNKIPSLSSPLTSLQEFPSRRKSAEDNGDTCKRNNNCVLDSAGEEYTKDRSEENGDGDDNDNNEKQEGGENE